MKKINDLTRAELIEFHIRMGARLNVKYVGDPGIIQRLWKMLLTRITRKFTAFVPDEVFELRPMCFKNIIFLPWIPGDPKVAKIRQILTAIHEATHSLRIRKARERSNVKTAQWYAQYFTNFGFRALAETSAQMAEKEFYFWYDGIIRQLDLTGYALNNEALELAQKDFNKQCEQLEQLGRGTAFHRAAAMAISILKEMGIKQIK